MSVLFTLYHYWWLICPLFSQVWYKLVVKVRSPWPSLLSSTRPPSSPFRWSFRSSTPNPTSAPSLGAPPLTWCSGIDTSGHYFQVKWILCSVDLQCQHHNLDFLWLVFIVLRYSFTWIHNHHHLSSFCCESVIYVTHLYTALSLLRV